MLLTAAIISSIMVLIADLLLVHKNKPIIKRAALSVSNVCFCNIATVFITDAALRYTSQGKLFSNADYPYLPLIYFVVLIAAGCCSIAFLMFLNGELKCVTENEPKKKQLCIRILSIVLFASGVAAFTGTLWGISTFGDLAPDQMLINMFSPRDGTSSDIMVTLWTGPVFQTAAYSFVFALFVLSRRVFVLSKNGKEKRILSSVSKTIICFALSFAVLTGGLANGIVKFDLIKIVKMYTVKSSVIEENFVNPRNVTLQFPKKKRNLIHIYLESMENTYASKNLGGYSEENLIKPLTDLAEEGYCFSNNHTGLGGPVATTGCVWSVAAMVNMNTGLPMKVPTGAVSYSEPGKFMPGAVGLGDILESQGYEQTLMFGATAKFGGLDFFYEEHGNFKIMDYDYAKNTGMIAPSYKEWWGYEDDKLFDFAKNEITRLYETGNPFNFVMETADTHFPDGYVGKYTPRKSDNQYADVISYSAEKTAEFVKWIREQPFYENTTVVIIGDHLSMDAKFFKDFDDSEYLRTTFNLILNPAEEVTNIPKERLQNRWYFNGDMFPTILASIGVKIEGEKLALGTNLFSDEKTLFEQYGGKEGWKEISKQFEYLSTYYYDYISDGDSKPFDTKNISYY